MKVDNNGWLLGVEQRHSPFFNARPVGKKINLLVIHGISLPENKFGTTYIDDLFLGKIDINKHPSFASLKGLQVSAHIVINREGIIRQYVSFLKRAWHAGVSCFENIENCNDYSIGIELEGSRDFFYEDKQYQALILLTKTIMQKFPDITLDRIVGHKDIAPVRKTDPWDTFDWQRFFNGPLA